MIDSEFARICYGMNQSLLDAYELAMIYGPPPAPPSPPVSR